MFQIDSTSSIPAFEQLEFCVKAAMASGRLRPHEQLPSIREIADSVNLNPNTVAKTFRGLEVDGFVYTQRGRGIFAGEDTREMGSEFCRSKLSKMYSEIQKLALDAGISINDLAIGEGKGS